MRENAFIYESRTIDVIRDFETINQDGENGRETSSSFQTEIEHSYKIAMKDHILSEYLSVDLIILH